MASIRRQALACAGRAARDWRSVAIRLKSLRRPNMRSMALRPRYRTGLKHGFQRRLLLGGMLGVASRSSMAERTAFVS